MARLTAQERLWRSIAECDVQRTLTETADALGAIWHHETDSRRTKRGWPDLAIPVAPVFWVIECKKELEQLEPPQAVWAAAVSACTEVRYRLVRPSNLAEVVEEITRERSGA
jgi:hypothetical protein